MATVTIQFTDVEQGAMDGACHLSFKSDPPIVVNEDFSPVEDGLSLAQRQGLCALGAVQGIFDVLDVHAPPLAESPEGGG